MPTSILLGTFAALAMSLGTGAVAQDAPREYKPVSVSEDDLSRYREEFLNRTNERRRAGREDKQNDREKTPPDLKLDPILCNAGQWLADLMARFDDENKPAQLACPHEATKIGGDPSMERPVDRIRYFGWPKDDNNFPGAGTEANAARSPNGQEFSGAMFADQLMDTNTHYRPFYAYKLNKIGDHDFLLMGVGIGKSQRGNYFCCVVFGNPVAPVEKLTDEQVEALPGQVIEQINAYRQKEGLDPVEAHEKLVETAQARAKLLAERKGNLPDDDAPKTQYQGGTIYTDNKGAMLKDAASFARFVIEGDDPLFKPAKFKHVGVGIALDGDGVPYITVYAGHP
ncbi:MAG: hypothetical protein U0835_25690 [Isosphaeraceae bacterium]